MSPSNGSTLRHWMWLPLAAAIGGAALCAYAAWERPANIWQSYLFAFVTCWLVAMGAAGLVALGNLTGGRWAEAARPYYVAAMQTLPLLAVLFVPLAFGLSYIYVWANPDSASQSAFSPGKAMYLSRPFFLVRAAGYFVVWIAVARWLGVVSRPQLPPASTSEMRRAGAVSLVLLVPTTTFAAFDWAMSLEPQWYSSIYGAILTAGGVVAAHALALVGLAVTGFNGQRADSDGDDRTMRENQLRGLYGDLGNLTLAFIMVWTYLSFSQFLIIWYGNLPSEITWYQRRFANGWQFVALAVLAGCFVVPFAALLSRELKRSVAGLTTVAVLLLFAYSLNMYWTILPVFVSGESEEHAAFVGALVAMAGVLLAAFFFKTDRHFAD